MKMKITTAEDAIQIIKNGQRVFIHGSAATPTVLLNSLLKKRGELRDIELVSITTIAEHPLDNIDLGESFFVNSLFVSKHVRQVVNGPKGDYVPVFLSEIPLLFERNILPVDVALIHVSPPDAHGYCSLGTSVDIARSAVRNAKWVIAQVNPLMPRTHGDGFVHIDTIDLFVEVNEALPEVDYSDHINEATQRIGEYCSQLIDDRSTLQMGIGSIPDAVLNCLHNHKDLGIHTEMFSDGLLPLVQKGIITNRYKKKHRDKIVTGFVLGTKKLYDFVNDNPRVAFLDISYVNDSGVIRTNPKVVAINSAIEIDLTGQVCADSIGDCQYSGVGGQMDFMRGAALSEGGKPIIALTSTTKNGHSKIVPFLQHGSAVTTTRAHVHYVVTEYGIADLFGKNLQQRAEALRDIAHPDHREWLDQQIGKTYR